MKIVIISGHFICVARIWQWHQSHQMAHSSRGNFTISYAHCQCPKLDPCAAPAGLAYRLLSACRRHPEAAAAPRASAPAAAHLRHLGSRPAAGIIKGGGNAINNNHAARRGGSSLAPSNACGGARASSPISEKVNQYRAPSAWRPW